MTLRRAWLTAVLLLYLALTAYQLGLPGLQYDEAKEAGANAMQILTGAPVTAFRDAGVTVAGRTLPLMVQDYIGALNVYLALPFLGLSGIGVPNLRLLPVLTGLLALLLLERAVSEWQRRSNDRRIPPPAPRAHRHTPISLSGLLAVTLLAVSPSYVFWARQGIFVTNLMLPFVFLCLWQGLSWLRTGRATALIVAALAGGLALYAKLLAVWVIAPFVVLAGGWWLIQRVRHPDRVPRLTLPGALGAVLAFALPLAPLVLFNLQTGGTLASIGGNLQHSYYGVNNADVLANLPVRLGQVLQVLRGDQFWYLGGVFANPLAPWLAAASLAAGLWHAWRHTLPPLLLVAGAVGCSLFTVSDLFVTHYVLIQPLVVAAVAIALGAWLEPPHAAPAGRWLGANAPNPAIFRFPNFPRDAVAIVVGIWLAVDLSASAGYHATLSATGGLAAHSDASYHLAYHLQTHGMGAPIALDWGIDAPVRYLTEGAVTPIEIFGYASPAAPDDGFANRLAPFLDNPDNRYVLHAPSATVFAGRREAFQTAVAARHTTAVVEQQFTQRDGTPLYEIWRVE